MKPARRGLFSFLADMAIRLRGNRSDAADCEQRVRRYAYRTDASGLGIRMTSYLRDRLRRGWLRIRREH